MGLLLCTYGSSETSALRITSQAIGARICAIVNADMAMFMSGEAWSLSGGENAWSGWSVPAAKPLVQVNFEAFSGHLYG